MPPFLGDPQKDVGRSPYVATVKEVIDALGTSLHRCLILRGWLAYRAELLKLELDGFQWVAGSFCEDVSFRVPSRTPPEPDDIDIVTFVRLPEGADGAALATGLVKKRELFNPLSKQKFKCDAYFGAVVAANHVDLQFATYWYGLFSHRRTDFQWKGLLRVELASNDPEAADALAEIEQSLALAIPVTVGDDR